MRAQRVPGLRGWCVGPPVGVGASGGSEKDGDEDSQKKEGMMTGGERAEGRDFGESDVRYSQICASSASFSHICASFSLALLGSISCFADTLVQASPPSSRTWTRFGELTAHDLKSLPTGLLPRHFLARSPHLLPIIYSTSFYMFLSPHLRLSILFPFLIFTSFSPITNVT